jgi:hypothetical protein
MTEYQLEMFPDMGLQWVSDDDIENPAHYKDYPIPPTKYNMENKLDWCEANVVKYITRWKDKDGLKDLKKARKYISILIEKEEARSVEKQPKPDVQEPVLGNYISTEVRTRRM